MGAGWILGVSVVPPFYFRCLLRYPCSANTLPTDHARLGTILLSDGDGNVQLSRSMDAVHTN